MSLVGTLAKVAIGVAAAKGIGYMVNKRGSGGPGTGASPDDGGLFGGAPTGPGAAATSQPSLQDMLGSILGGGAQAGTSAGGLGGAGALGGLGGLLEQLSGRGAQAGGAGAAPGGGGLDALIGGLVGAISGGPGAAAGRQAEGGSFAEVLNQSFRNGGEPEVKPAPQQEAAAGLMLRAMLQAAKSDGKLDDRERAKLVEALGDASPEDVDFVNRELASPVDVKGLAAQVPKGLEQQIYTVSVMGIDLDSQAEAQYLAALSTALGLAPRDVNAMHAKLGVPALFK